MRHHVTHIVANTLIHYLFQWRDVSSTQAVYPHKPLFCGTSCQVDSSLITTTFVNNGQQFSSPHIPWHVPLNLQHPTWSDSLVLYRVNITVKIISRNSMNVWCKYFPGWTTFKQIDLPLYRNIRHSFIEQPVLHETCFSSLPSHLASIKV